MKVFVANKITRNNTLKKVHVAMTDPSQLLSQHVWRSNRTKSLSDFVQL